MTKKRIRRVSKTALLAVMALSPLAMTSLISQTVADAATSPSIALNLSSLTYGYAAPQTVTVTGQDFNGSSNVYVLNSSGQNLQVASGVTLVSANEIRFNLGPGLGSYNATTTYTVEVKTVEGANTLETTQPATLTVAGITPTISTPSVKSGYSATAETITLPGMSLDNQATVQLLNSANTDTSDLQNVSVNGQTITATVGSGLLAGDYTVRIKDGANTVDIPFTVAAAVVAPLSITTTSLPAVAPSQSYSGQLQASVSSGVTWSISNKPSWLNLNASTGALTGTAPQGYQTTNLEVTATPTSGQPVTKSVILPLTSSASITTTSLPAATQGTAYSATLAASGASGVTWSATGLPSGLSVSPSTGAISGTPTESGTFTVSVAAQTANGGTATATLTLMVAASNTTTTTTTTTPTPPTTSTGSGSGSTSTGSSPGTVTSTPTGASSGSTTTTTTTATSSGTGLTSTQPGKGASAVPELSTVLFSQTITSLGGTFKSDLGTGSISIQAPAGAFTSPVKLSLSTESVSALNVQNLPPESRPMLVFGVNFGGATPTKPVTVSLTGFSLPADASVYKLTAKGTLVPVKATMSGGVLTISFTSDPDFVILTPTLTVMNPVMYAGIKGRAYKDKLVAARGSAPYTWSIASGQLPKGLRLDSQSGVIEGRPSAPGKREVTVQVTDKSGYTASQSYVFDVVKPNEREIVVNGTAMNVPAVVHKPGKIPTTYVPIWYLMHAMKGMGFTSRWNGHQWTMTTDNKSSVAMGHAGTGEDKLLVNGKLVQKFTTITSVDPFTHKPTAYAPLWDLIRLLDKFHMHSVWSGTTWVITSGQGKN